MASWSETSARPVERPVRTYRVWTGYTYRLVAATSPEGALNQVPGSTRADVVREKAARS